MWRYKVINAFKDLQDNEYLYTVGDVYPREGYIPDKKRIDELKGSKNKIGRSLIKAERVKKGR